MSPVTDRSTDCQSVYLGLRELLFSDQEMDQLLATLGPDAPILQDAIAQMRAGCPTEVRPKLEDARTRERFAGDAGYWIVLAEARRIDGDAGAARDAVRQILKIERLETRWELQAWALLRELGAQPDGDSADEVLGVVVDMGMAGGWATVAGFADGDARIFWSSGGGILGDLRIFPQVAAAAKRLVSSAQRVVSALSCDDAHALPPAGCVRFALLTRAGIYAIDEEETGVQSCHHLLYPVYVAMHGLIANLRLVYEGRAAGSSCAVGDASRRDRSCQPEE